MNIEDIDSLQNKVVTSSRTNIYHFQLETNMEFIEGEQIACAVRQPKNGPTKKKELKIDDEKLKHKRPCKRCIRTLDSHLSDVIKSCEICNRVNISHDSDYEHIYISHGMEDHRNNNICEDCLDEIQSIEYKS
jgi:hypothetical protein